jgi:NAD(P)H dehydrogenase (quinone)
MNILIVYAHPVSSSFNSQVLESVKAELLESGHQVKVADLYAEGFQCAMTADDFVQFEGKPMPEEIREEQARVEWSDGLVFIFPIWWWSLPAILKGWIDRVMSYGWAWVDPNDPNSGYLKKRKILVLASAGASAEALAKREYDKAFQTQFEVGICEYCGFKDVTMQFLYSITLDSTETHIKKQLEKSNYLARTVFL